MLKFDLGEFFLGTKNIRYNSKIVSWDFKPPPPLPRKKDAPTDFFWKMAKKCQVQGQRLLLFTYRVN